MSFNNLDDKDEIVTIKLEKWCIPYILGAMQLGIVLEDWCAVLWYTTVKTYDTHSAKWIMNVAGLKKMIQEQTGVNEENTEYGDTGEIELINKWINEQCEINEKTPLEERENG